jgi:hypothetical protein
MLAADPGLTPSMYARLANMFPEVWEELLANPSIHPELRAWIETSLAALREAQHPTAPVHPLQDQPGGQIGAGPVASRSALGGPVKRRTRSRRRRQSRIGKVIWILLPPIAIIALLFTGVNIAMGNAPVVGVLTTTRFEEPSRTVAWQHDLAPRGKARCADFSFQTYEQDLALVLVQNDWANEECAEQDDPAASILTLLNTRTGAELWSVDLAEELNWTHTWRAELLSMPALDQIMVRFTDITGEDVPSDGGSLDKGDSRKMKSVVPYNPLNGRVSDMSIAAMADSPVVQAPVLEVLQVPGSTKDVVLMANGNDKDFRYARYRAKILTEAHWTYESNLKPIGGNAFVGESLILGRNEDDKPRAVSIESGNVHAWRGPAGGKLYTVAGSVVHVAGDGSSETVTNETSQGGLKGHDVTLTGLTAAGEEVWTADARGYALAQFAPSSTLEKRREYSGLYLLSGKNNVNLQRFNVVTGEPVWSIKPGGKHFEVGRGENDSEGVLYLTKDGDDESKSVVFVTLTTGKLTTKVGIVGKSERVDGMTRSQVYLVDEPQRSRFYQNAENGTSTTSDGKDHSDENRICAVARVPGQADELWSWECDGNQHVLLLGGNWVVFDEKPGKQKLIRFSR